VQRRWRALITGASPYLSEIGNAQGTTQVFAQQIRSVSVALR
jgi:hypothetical protein